MKRFLLILSVIFIANLLTAQHSNCADAMANASYDTGTNTCLNGPHPFLMSTETASGFFDAAAFVPDCDLGSTNTVDLWFKITAAGTDLSVSITSPSSGHNIMIFDAATIDCADPTSGTASILGCYTKTMAGADYVSTCGDLLTMGNDYYVVITMPAGSAEDISDLCFGVPTVVNDDPCTAIALTNGLNEPSTTICAVNEVGIAGCPVVDAENQVWFSYTTPAGGTSGFNVTINNVNSGGPVIAAVFTMTDCVTLAGLTQIENAECNAETSLLTINCTDDNQEYFIAVSTSSANETDFGIQIDDIVDTSCNTNDDCTDAIDLNSDPLYDPLLFCEWQTLGVYCNLDACPEVDPVACLFELFPTVWFEITAPPTATTFSVEIVGSTLVDPTVGVFNENGCSGSYTEAAVGSGCGFAGLEEDIAITGGNTYYILVGTNSSDGGDFEVLVKFDVPPSNDECANATNILEGAANTLVGETNECSSDLNDFLTACPADDDANVWYEFTTDADDQKMEVLIENATFGGVTNLVVVDACGAVNDIYNSCDAVNEVNSFCVIPNTQYWIQIGTADANVGDFDLTVLSVDETVDNNDACSSPAQTNGGIAITSDCVPITYDGSNVAGCNETFTIGTCDFDIAGNPTVWYEFTTDANTDLATINLTNLVGGPFNIALYQNNCPTPTDQGGACGVAPDYLEDIVVDPSTTYLVAISSTSANEGTYTLNISLADLPDNDECDNATPLTFGTILSNEANICATDINDYSVPTCPDADDEANVWYEFTTGATDQKIRVTIINVTLGGNATMIVFDDCNGANEIYSTCSAEGENEFCAEANTTYKIQLGTSDLNTGDFDILVENIDETVDQNDVCDNAQQVNGGTALMSNCEPLTYNGSNVDACSESFTEGGCNFDMAEAVWYEFTTDADAQFADITFENATVPVTVTLYNDDCASPTAISGCATAPPYLEDVDVTPNTTYHVLVGTTGAGGTYDLVITVKNPPENDDCIAAEYVAHILTDGNTLVMESTFCASPDIGPTCGPLPADVNTVWYEYTVPANVKEAAIDITNWTSTNDIAMVAVDGCNSTNIYDNNPNNEYCGGAGTEILVIDCPTEGDVIFIAVGTENGFDGTFDIVINETLKDATCTANDDCINAEVLTPDAGFFCDWQPFNGNCNLTACPEDFDFGAPCNYLTQPYVWFEVTIPADVTLMDIRIPTGGSLFGDIAFGVFDVFDCISNPTPAAAGSDCVSAPAGMPEITDIVVVPGNTYYIAVGDMTGIGGDFNFEIKFTLAPANDDPCATADIPVLIDGVAEVDQTNICATEDLTTGNCDPNQESSVWYYYTIPAGDNGFKITVTGSGGSPIAPGTDLSMVIVETTGCGAGAFELEECTTEGTEETFPCLMENTTYAIMIATSEDNEGQFDILLEALPEDPACIDNDICANADDAFPGIVTDGGEECITDCNQDACPEDFFSGACDFNLEEVVWYSVTTDATPDASMNVNVTSADFNPILAVLTADCANPTAVSAESGCLTGDGTSAFINNLEVMPNTTYLIIVAPSTDLDGGEFTLCVELTTSCNDDPCSPVAITGGTTYDDPDNDCTTNIGSTEDFIYDDGNCPNATVLGEASVYFSYQAIPNLSSFEVVVSGGGVNPITSELGVTVLEYDVANCDFAQTTIVGQECGDINSIANTEVECPITDNVYLIQISTAAGDEGDFSIEIIENISSVANDACEEAEVMDITVFCEWVEFIGDNTDACPEDFTHGVCNYEDGHFVWYEVTIPPGVESMDVNLLGTTTLQDPAFGVLTTACGISPPTAVPGGDCVTGGINPELLNIAVNPGDTYYIVVGSQTIREDEFTLSVRLNKPPDNDECDGAVSVPVGGGENGTTECASNSLFPFTNCAASANEADVWYEIPLALTDEIISIDITGFTGDGNYGAQVYTTTTGCGALTPAEESGVLLEDCGPDDKHFEFSVKCLDPMPTSLFVLIGSASNDGDPDNGVEEGMFNISVSPATSCDYADECEDAETFTSDTPGDCSDPQNFIDVPGCLEFACPDPTPGNCGQGDGPTVWFQIEIDSDDATKLITQVVAPGFDAVWSVYFGTTCADMQPISEQLVIGGVTQTFPCSDSDGDATNIFQVAIEAMSSSNGVSYWVAVTAVGPVDDPNFTLTYASALPCLACSGEDGFDCGNGAFEAEIDGEVVEEEDYNNFCQGETVQVCLDFNYNTTGSGNDWFHGIVPSFGPGWDLEASDLASQAIGMGFEYFDSEGNCGAYLNGYALPNVCTYMEDGILKLCNEACNPGGCPCSGGMEAGDLLPSGWWVNSPGGSATCSSACTPSDDYGWPSGTNLMITDFCFEMVVKEFDDPAECEENKDLRIIFQTFSDAISGCWDDSNPCVIDPSFQGPAWEINCNVPPDPVITPNPDEICSGTAFNVNISTEDGSNLEINVEAEDNPNVIGEMDYTVWGDETIGDILTNLGSNTEIVNYFVTVIDPDIECESPKDTLQVIVYADLQITFNEPLGICEDATEPIDVCAMVTGGTGNYSTYTWDNGIGVAGPCISVQPTVTTTYCVEVTDDFGCNAEECVTVTVSPLIVPSLEIAALDAPEHTICQSDGGFIDVELFITGGSPTFDFDWEVTSGLEGFESNGGYTYTIDVENSINHGIPHIIKVTMVDAAGCTGEAEIEFNLLDFPLVEGEILAAPCAGEAGEVELAISTQAGLNYLVNLITVYNCDDIQVGVVNNSSTNSILVEASDCYYIVAEDQGGCIGYDTIELSTGSVEEPVLSGIIDFCLGDGDYTITLDNAGLYEGYEWSTGSTGTSITVTPDSANTYIYTVTVTQSGCTTIGQHTVNVYDPPEIVLSGSTKFCSGPGGSTTIDVGGDPDTWTYTWTDPSGSPITGDSSSLTVTAGGDYNLTVTDANGCMNTKTVSFEEDENLAPVIPQVDLCVMDTANIDAGPSFETYEWTLEGSTDVLGTERFLEITQPGKYCVFVTDTTGCSGDTCMTVNLYDPPIVGLDTAVVYNGIDQASCDTSINFNTYVNGDAGVFSDCFLNGIDISDLSNVSFFEKSEGYKRFCFTTTSATDPCEEVVDTFVVLVKACECPNLDLLTPDPICNSADTLDLNSNEVKNTLEDGSWSVIDGPTGQDLNSIIYNGSNFVSTDLIGGNYEVQFKLNDINPECDSVNTVLINVTVTPELMLSDTIFACNKQGQSLAAIHDFNAYIQTGNTEGEWTDILNPGAVDASDSTNVNFTDINPGLYVFRYCTTDAIEPCDDVCELLYIRVQDCSCPITITDDTTVCNIEGIIELDTLVNSITPGHFISGAADVSDRTFDHAGLTGGDYIIIFEYDDGIQGCDDQFSFIITVVEQPSATFYDADDVCGNKPNGTEATSLNLNVLLEPGSDLTGTWSDTDDTGVIITADGTIDFDGVLPVEDLNKSYTFTYTIEALDPCMEISYEVEIFVKDCNCNPLDISGFDDVCNVNGSVNLDGHVADNTSTNGEWTIDPFLTIPSTGIIDVTDATPGIYTLTYTINDQLPNCPTAVSDSFEVFAPSWAGVGSTVPVCFGGTEEFEFFSLLTDNPDLGGSWTSTQVDGFNAVDGTFNITSIPAGSYSFEYVFETNGECAGSTATVIVNVLENPIANAGDDLAIDCANPTVDLDGTGSSSNMNYQWYNSSGPITGETSTTLTALGADTYTIEVTNPATGCVSSDEVIVTASDDVPKFELSKEDPLCNGDSNGSINIINLSGGDGNYMYELDGVAGTQDSWDGLPSGNYTITVIDGIGCMSSVQITLDNPPLVTVDIVQESHVIDLGTGEWINLANPASHIGQDITWTKNDTIICTSSMTGFCDSIYSDGLNTDTYCVEVVDENGCSAKDCIQIRTQRIYENYIPTVFNPEDPNAEVSTFFMSDDLGIKNITLFNIYSRWGELIFSVKDIRPNDPSVGWDGTYKGKYVDPAVYVYVIEVIYDDDTLETFTGDVTVNR